MIGKENNSESEPKLAQPLPEQVQIPPPVPEKVTKSAPKSVQKSPPLPVDITSAHGPPSSWPCPPPAPPASQPSPAARPASQSSV